MSDAPVSQHDYVSNRLSSLATSNDVTLADSWPLEKSQEIPQGATLNDYRAVKHRRMLSISELWITPQLSKSR